MSKSVFIAGVCLLLITAVVFSTQANNGQSDLKIQKSSKGKVSTKPAKKIVKPTGQAAFNPPDISIVGSEKEKSTKPAVTQAQTSEMQSQSPLTSCDWTLLLLEEVNPYELVVSVPFCPFCVIPSELTHSNSSILGFSLSPDGPWTESIIVMTTLNGSGVGVSETFYVKGEAVGASTIHADSIFDQLDIEFQVVACECPEIPIVP